MEDDIFKYFDNNKNEIEEEIKEPSEPLYKKYFNGTKNLKNNFNNPELNIINGCRKFKSNISEGYDEVFLTDKQKIFAGISSQITYLFPKNNRISDNRIGFRFYENEPTKIKDEISFFTLLLTSNRKFIILEKNSDVIDNEGKNFIDDKLDCLKIIIKIIKNKFIAKDIFEFNFPYSLVELLGFCYAIKQNQYTHIEILEPYFPDDFDISSKKENFIITEKKIFLEPLLCNQHVSLLVFYYYKKKEYLLRCNYIFDFSSAHYESLKNYDPIFIIEQMNCILYKFPKTNLQFGGSSSIWFISTFLCLTEFKIKVDLFDNNQFLIKIIKKIENLMGLDNETIIDYKNIESRNNENISSSIFISYKIVFNSFVDVKELLFHFYETFSNDLINDLEFYQLRFNELKNKIKNLKLNSAYYKLISDNIRVDEKEIENLIQKYYKAQEMFITLIEIKLEIIKGSESRVQEDLHEFFEIRNKFQKQDQNLRRFLYDTINDVYRKLFIFTNKQFLIKLNDTKDIFNIPYDK